MSGTPWTLRYDPRVKRQLEKIRDHSVLQRLASSAKRLETQPRLGKQLEGYQDIRSYRVGTPGGEYRILYRLILDHQVVLILLIAPRDDVYELLERRG